MRSHVHHVNRLLGPALFLMMAACAPAPIYKAPTSAVIATPMQVSQSPERYTGGAVIWGGRIVNVTNLSDHSEVEVLAYPLDGSQRPKASDAGNGRFVVVLPGYVEPLNYPAGSLITVSGTLNGSHAGKVGEADYVFPLISATQSHVWTQKELNQGRSNISFGLGVGVGIH
jgi:outer membrane lipoprotein